MEITFSQLRAKEVINTQDGKKLGKVCDVVLTTPDNRWIGIVAPCAKGWGWKKNGVFIDLRCIVKIGEDVILVNIGVPQKCGTKRSNCDVPPCEHPRRSYEEYE